MRDCENCEHYKIVRDENGYPYGHMCEVWDCDKENEDDKPDLDCALRE